MEYASFGEAPTQMLYWTGVSTVAGALRRRCWIDMKYFEWVPNFYVILVAPPGIVSKSTTANIGMNLLRKVPGIFFGPDIVTWQALVTSLAESAEMAHWPLREEYLPMSCVTISSDEFGNFLNPNDREMVDLLVSLWDGKKGTFNKVTKMAGKDVVENPWVNIIACTTPEWISGNFPRYMIGGGFTSRCVFVYAEEKRQEIPYVDEVVTPNFDAMQTMLVHDLEVISTMVGPFSLDAEARDWGRAWYSHHWRNPPAELRQDEFGGYLARKQTHIHKLAMIHSAAENSNLVITKENLESAAAIVSANEASMPKVFARIGQTEITRAATDIVTAVNRAGRITEAELYRQFFKVLTWKDFQDAVTSAMLVGYVKRAQEGDAIVLRSVK